MKPITPEAAPRRFDTYFFAAIAPPGQVAEHDGIETTAHVWIKAEQALEEMSAGTRRIIFPTACNLATFAGFSNADQALEASRARPVIPVIPALEERDGRQCLVIPPEAGYPRAQELFEQSTRPRGPTREGSG